jgi:hypothetical protein
MGEENKEMNYAAVKEQVLELLNQIAILTKDVPEPQTYEDYNYREGYVTTSYLADYGDDVSDSIDQSKVNDDAVYLYCVNNYVKRVIDGDAESASHNELQYYTSNC